MLDAVMEFLALASEWPNAKNDILKIFQRAVDVEKFAKVFFLIFIFAGIDY